MSYAIVSESDVLDAVLEKLEDNQFVAVKANIPPTPSENVRVVIYFQAKVSFNPLDRFEIEEKFREVEDRWRPNTFRSLTQWLDVQDPTRYDASHSLSGNLAFLVSYACSFFPKQEHDFLKETSAQMRISLYELGLLATKHALEM